MSHETITLAKWRALELQEAGAFAETDEQGGILNPTVAETYRGGLVLVNFFKSGRHWVFADELEEPRKGTERELIAKEAAEVKFTQQQMDIDEDGGAA